MIFQLVMELITPLRAMKMSGFQVFKLWPEDRR
jgi:hypothetical protein